MTIDIAQKSLVRSGQRNVSLALTLLLAVGQAAASPPPQFPAQVTGTALVRDMQASPRDDELNNTRRERAMGYIDGVMDAGVGRQWCPAGKRVPHELNYLVIEEMARMSRATLNRNASELVSIALARLFPCKAGSAS
jgi:hypothetical protein